MPMKYRDLIRLIEDDGSYLHTTVGSHRQYRHPLKPGRVTVAGQPGKDVPEGTRKSILKQAGLEKPHA
jgi:predicted RNA binding protein YcfA (HicA-like mRNA interferase family)